MAWGNHQCCLSSACHGAAPLALWEGESQPRGTLGMNVWNSRGAGDVFLRRRWVLLLVFGSWEKEGAKCLVFGS